MPRRAVAVITAAAALSSVLVSAGAPDAAVAAAAGPLLAGSVLEVQVAGRAGIPSDAVAATLNVTAVTPWADGYLTVYPCGEAVPTASNLNFRALEPAVPNAVVARLGTGGKICIVSSAYTQVVVDVAGYVPAGSPISPLASPRRLVDTREGLGAPLGRTGPGVLTVQVAGRGGIPADAGAAVLNVTAVDPDGPGFATVFPCDQPRPTASNLNYVARDVRPNLVLADLDPQGRTCVFTMTSTHLVIDATAAVGDGAGLQLVANPERVLDTRLGLGGPAHPLAGNVPQRLRVAGRAGVPTGATAVVLNATATESGAAGYVTVYPCGDVPTVSNLNHSAGQTVANLVVAALDANGDVCLLSNAGTHLVVDVAGWFTGTSAHRVLPTPQRLYDSRSSLGVPPAPAPVPIPGPPSSIEPTPPSLVFESTTTSSTSTTTTTTVPWVPIDTEAPCDLLIFPVRNGSIRIRDLITGDQFVATDPWFVDGQAPVVARDCSGLLVAGPGTESLNTSSVRYYRFDGAVFTYGAIVPSPLGNPTTITQLDDGRVLASVGAWTWDVATGDVYFVPTTGTYLLTAGVARDGSVVALETGTSGQYDLQVYARASGQLLRTTTLPPHGKDTVMSPDGTRIALGTYPPGSSEPPPSRSTPVVRLLDGTLVASYPLGELSGSLAMRWAGDTQLIVCSGSRQVMLWTVGGSVVDLGEVALGSSCPTIG